MEITAAGAVRTVLKEHPDGLTARELHKAIQPLLSQHGRSLPSLHTLQIALGDQKRRGFIRSEGAKPMRWLFVADPVKTRTSPQDEPIVIAETDGAGTITLDIHVRVVLPRSPGRASGEVLLKIIEETLEGIRG